MAKVLSDKMIEWAKEKYAEGYAKYEIAEALYVNEVTIRKQLKDEPKPERKKLVYDGSDKKAFIRQSVKAGYYHHEVADALGMHKLSISQYCTRYGIKKAKKPALIYDFSQE